MGKNIVQKIIESHLVSGNALTGEEISVSVDQTLTQDATGTMSYLQFEAMGIDRVKTRLSVSYVDHNMLQLGFENADDHRYLQSVAKRYGIYFSRPGNGICHQVHLERFGAPGEVLLGADSHTPTCGGVGMLAIGVGGLDIAVAMAGRPYYLKMPKVVRIELKGRLKDWVTAKDIIFELLRRLTVKGGTGKIFEYTGEGVSSLSVPERSTITNMGAELGLTTSIFPSDDRTKEFLKAQKRFKDFKELLPDKDARYDETLEIDLNLLEPLIACPHSPDNVRKVKEVSGKKVHQVAIGSCTNSSYSDLMIVAKILEGKKVHPEVSLVVTPGSKQVLEMVTRDGGLASLIASGARILESACGPCIGMGQAPPSGGVSIRSFNRNFKGRAGTLDSDVYLASPQTCAACALKAEITDPRELGLSIKIDLPADYIIDDELIIPPSDKPESVEVIRGPNIAPIPLRGHLDETMEGEVLIKLGDNISTDDILPAGPKILSLRSNIPKISDYVFFYLDQDFSSRAKKKGGGFILGGINYGQGSSREHAALGPMYLGIKAVLAKSFARIHKENLINFGIMPLVFTKESGYQEIEQGDVLSISQIRDILSKGEDAFRVGNNTKNSQILLKVELTSRQRDILLAGGLLNYIRRG